MSVLLASMLRIRPLGDRSTTDGTVGYCRRGRRRIGRSQQKCETICSPWWGLADTDNGLGLEVLAPEGLAGGSHGNLKDLGIVSSTKHLFWFYSQLQCLRHCSRRSVPPRRWAFFRFAVFLSPKKVSNLDTAQPLT